MSLQLPCKKHLSLPAVASRWSVDADTINQYIYDREILRVAIPKSSLYPEEFRAIKLSQNNYMYLKEELRCYNLKVLSGELFLDVLFNDPVLFNLDELAGWLSKSTNNVSDRFVKIPEPLPDYLYIIPFESRLFDGFGPTPQEAELFVEDFKGQKYLLTKRDQLDPAHLECITPLLHRNSMNVIPTEELERFEKEFPQDMAIESTIPLSPKTRNVYLRTIRSLSDALIDGLTGKHSKDALAVLSKLKEKNLEAPLKEDALANYLKEAEKL